MLAPLTQPARRDDETAAPESRTVPWVARVLSEARRRWLGHRRSHRWLVLLSVLLCATSLGAGLCLDDHAHRLLVRGHEGAGAMWVTPPHPLDLFRFVDGGDADYRHALETGMAPWYTSPRLRLAFARPLASLTHAFDYRLLDAAPWAMHVHSLLWLLLLGLAVARLVRRLEGGWVAGLVILFYVLDVGHGVPAGWLANRNQLIVGALGALAVDAHVRWRRSASPGGPRGALATMGLFALGLLAGESMAGWLAFLVAFAVVLDPAGLRRGLASLAPVGAVVVVWRLAYRALGYGAAASSLYVDPLADPLRFVAASFERMPQLLFGQLGGPPPGIAAMGGRSAELVAAAVAVVALAVMGALLVPVLRHDRMARFWALSALLAAMPVSATHPHARLMLVGGLGTAGLAARFIQHVVNESSGRAPRALAAFWLVALGVLSPLRLPLEARSMTMLARPSELAIASIPPEAIGRTLVVVAVPDPMFMCGQLTLALASLERPRPERFRCLAGIEGAASVTRQDAHTLLVRVPAGLMSPFFAPLLRDHPFEPDWSLQLSDLRFELAEHDPGGNPVALRVRFEAPLDAPEHVFVAWSPEHKGFRLFPLPAVGETVQIAGEPVARVMLSR